MLVPLAVREMTMAMIMGGFFGTDLPRVGRPSPLNARASHRAPDVSFHPRAERSAVDRRLFRSSGSETGCWFPIALGCAADMTKSGFEAAYLPIIQVWNG